MKNMKVTCVLIVFYFQSVIHIRALSQCSVKLPVPDLSYCDATGSLEENVDSSLHETRGRIRAVKDYQQDSFKLFDQQFSAMLAESTGTDGDINEAEEEIMTLKRFLNNLMFDQANDELPKIEGTRQKRAAPSTSNPTQQSLNSARATFQQELAKVTQKLASISNSIAKDAAKSAVVHAKLLQELATNQQALTATEQQIQTLDTAIRNAVKTSSTGSSGVSLSAVTQDVTDLIINATVSEQIKQRQLDDLEKLDKKLETAEQVTASKLTTFTKDLNDLDKKLTKEDQDTMSLKGAEHIYEDRVGTFISNTTRDVANLNAELGTAKQSLAQVRRYVFNTTLTLGIFGNELTAYRKDVDGVQSIVTFSQPIQQKQSGDILKLKKTLADDINVLKYAFGLTKTPP